MDRILFERLGQPVDRLNRSWTVRGESRVGDGSHKACLRNRACRPRLIFVAGHPGADFAMEGMRFPKASHENVHVKQPDAHSLSSSILRECSKVTGSALLPGE